MKETVFKEGNLSQISLGSLEEFGTNGPLSPVSLLFPLSPTSPLSPWSPPSWLSTWIKIFQFVSSSYLVSLFLLNKAIKMCFYIFQLFNKVEEYSILMYLSNDCIIALAWCIKYGYSVQSTNTCNINKYNLNIKNKNKIVLTCFISFTKIHQPLQPF